MKFKGSQFAIQNGNSYIVTSNEVNNRAMLSKNERLGFQRQPDWIIYEKTILESQ